MTEKELLYIQDAISHAQHVHTKCTNLANQLQDQNLKTFAQTIAQRHKQICDTFYQLLNK